MILTKCKNCNHLKYSHNNLKGFNKQNAKYSECNRFISHSTKKCNCKKYIGDKK